MRQLLSKISKFLREECEKDCDLFDQLTSWLFDGKFDQLAI